MNSIALPENSINLINLILISLAVILVLIGYLKGFISQVYDLVVMGIGLLLGWLIAPALAGRFSLLPSSINFNEIPFLGGAVVLMISRALWAIIISIVILIIGFVFKGFILKKILHYKKKVLLDRLGGAALGFIPQSSWHLFWL